MSTLTYRAAILGILAANSLLLATLYAENRCRQSQHVEVALDLGPPPLPTPSTAEEEIVVVDIHRDDLARVELRDVLDLRAADRILRVNNMEVSGTQIALEQVLAADAPVLDLDVSRRGRRVRTIVLLH